MSSVKRGTRSTPRRSATRAMSRRSPAREPMIVAGAIWASVFVAGILGAGWALYLAWLVSGAAATFALYGFDKRQARRGGRRVPERVLMGASLLGGVAGAWAGMFLFRHKTQHTSFYLLNSMATALHVAIWSFLNR